MPENGVGGRKSSVSFLHGNEANLPQSVVEGAFLFTDDTNKFFLDIGGERHQIDRKDIYVGTKEFWDANPTLKSERGVLYVYTNAKSYVDKDNSVVNVPGFKIGDGLAYLIDMPFSMDVNLYMHANDNTVHIAEDERLFWNNKVSIDESDVHKEKLIFTIN